MANGPDSPYLAQRPTASDAPPAEGGEGTDLDAWYRQQYQPLVSFLHRRGHLDQDAEDVAQETFTRALPYVRSKPHEGWRPTIYRIAINILNDRLRRARIRRPQEQIPLDDLHVAADQPSLEELATRHQQQAWLRKALLELPPQCRRVCLLKLVRGMENAEVARHCGISLRMVEKHVARAMVTLQARFAHRDTGA